MQLYSYYPKGILSSFIDVIWVAQAEQSNYRNIILPMLNHELVINFSDHFEMIQDGVVQNKDYTAWLSGMQTAPIETITTGKHYMAGILFKPWGLFALTGINSSQFHNQCIDLKEVFGSHADMLSEQVYGKNGPREIAALLERFVLSQLKFKEIPSLLLASIPLLNSERYTDGEISHLATRLSVSAKTLIESYKKYIGLTPGKFRHLLLLNTVLKHLDKHPDDSLSSVGYEYNFSDQAHFIHFFKKYTGLTPRAYLKARAYKHLLSIVPNNIEIPAR